MQTRQAWRWRRCVSIAASAAALPLPAFAADAAMQAWGAYLFFAIVATVVIVLLLHEALDDDVSEDQRSDDAAHAATASKRTSEPARYGMTGERNSEQRRVA